MSSFQDGARASVPDSGADRHRARARALDAVCAVLLGLLLVYGAGFAETAEVHNGAHDSRHAAGFPCH